MSDTEITQNYKPVNKNVLVRVKESEQVLGNGMKFQEQRGKKDYLCGTVLLAEASLKISPKSLCWFPMYAGQPITLGGKEYMIVPFEDIVLLEAI